MKKVNFQNGIWIALTLFFGTIFFSSAASKVEPAKNSISQDCTVGEITLFSGDFIPKNWALCDGKNMQVPTYSDLFSIIGGRYGGDMRTTFKLPNLTGRAAIQSGYGYQFSTIQLGQKVGDSSFSNLQIAAAKKATSNGSDVTTVTGDLSGVDNKQQSIVLNYIICIQGQFPSRN